MPAPPEPGTVSDWLLYARSDLLLARTEPRQEILTEMLCFHAQQAAEKALKAVLVFLGTAVPRPHDLALLLSHVDRLNDVPVTLHRAARLTVYAVISRYPVDPEPVEAGEYHEAIHIAEQVVSWAESPIAATRS